MPCIVIEVWLMANGKLCQVAHHGVRVAVDISLYLKYTLFDMPDYRWLLKGQRGVVMWLTGLSGSGKVMAKTVVHHFTLTI